MTLAFIAVIFGLVLLVWSAERFVEGSASTARHFGMPPLLIGMVIVGFGTSAPEMVVSALGASQGNPECMEILGCLYFQGEEGVDRDYAKAFEWLNRCEEAGSLQSTSKLGYLYMKGEGCIADENKAKELFERAAQTECDGYALYELGFIYERKNESPEDLERAAQCYQKAIEMGNESASRRFSHFKKGLFGRWKITY